MALFASALGTIRYERFCDVCDKMPLWAEPVLVVIGFAIAIALLAGFVRISSWLNRRSAARRAAADEHDRQHSAHS